MAGTIGWVWLARRPLGRVLGVGAAVAALVLPVLVPPTARAEEAYSRPASGAFVLDGRGFGHGRGMSQWGAQGAALSARGYASILGFYYRGATMAERAHGEIRVRIAAEDGDAVLDNVAGLVGRDEATGVVINFARLGSRVRAVAAGGGTLRVQFWTGAAWQTVQNPAWPGGAVKGPFVFSGAPLWLNLPNGTAREYRGRMVARANGPTSLYVVNVLPFEHYLLGVVPRESPASTPRRSRPRPWQPVRTRGRHATAASRRTTCLKRRRARSMGAGPSVTPRVCSPHRRGTKQMQLSTRPRTRSS